jgi:hypothetical protein
MKARINSTIGADIHHETRESQAEQEAQNAAVIRLLEEWMADESGYDEAVWPVVKAAIEDNRLSSRKRFCD